MLRWLVKTSLSLRFLIVVLAAILMVVGIMQIRSAPVDIYPEFDPPIVEIQTEALGLSAAEMEALLTVPLEADLLNGVAWLDEIYSETVAGMSSILLVFEPGTDPIRARQMVQERLTQTFALPNVSSPPTMLQPLSTTSRAMMVGISSNELSLLDLGVLARWNIKPRLMGVPGVANVAIWGHRDRQLQVLVDPVRLEENNVSLLQIIESTGESLWVSPLSYLESSSPGTAGWIDTPNQRLSIRHELPISSADDLAKIAIEGTDGLLLGDVADVVEDHQPLIGDASLNNQAGLMLVIEKFPGANTLEVTRGVEEVLNAMRPGLTGVEIDATVFRPANYIEAAVGNLNTAMLIGGILLLIVVGLFFFNWRAALVSIVTVPLSLIAAAYILYLRGVTFNSMIVAGLVLALGVVVDNAVIDIHNIIHRLRQAGGSQSTRNIIFEAVMETRGSLMFALLMLLLMAAPIFLLPGLAGSFFAPLAEAYVLAMLVSLAVAIVITPALSMVVLGDTATAPKESPVMASLKNIYSGMANRMVHTPSLAIILAVILIIAGLLALPFLRVSLQPTFKQTELLIAWEAAPGTSRTEMNRITSLATEELRSLSGVRTVGSHVGRAITGDAIVSMNSGELWVSVDPNANYDETVAGIQEVIAGYPGLFRQVQTYQPERTAEALTGKSDDLVVRVYGDDLGVLEEKAQEISQRIAGIDGIAEARAETIVREPQVEIEVDLAAAEQHQIKPGDVRRQTTTLLSGLRVGNLYEEQKIFDVMVWGTPEIRSDLTAIGNLLISTPAGSVPLSDLAEIRIAPSPVVIKRDVVSRFIDVAITVSGRSLADVTADVQSSLKGVSFPLEYHAEVFGATAADQAARQRIISVVVVAVLGILLLMQSAFSSWKMALAALITLPAALAGSMWGAVLNGGVLSIGALFGLLTVLGIAIRNSVVMLKHFHYLELHEGETFGVDLALRGAKERMAPILTTAFALGLVLLPMIIAGNSAGFEITHSMAVVIFGGLITSTVLSLVILPALYAQFGSSPEPDVIESAGMPVPGMGTD